MGTRAVLAVTLTRVGATLAVLLGTAGVALAAHDEWLGPLLDTPEAVVAPSFGVVAFLLAAHPRARRMAGLLTAIALPAGVHAAASALTAHGAGDDGALHQAVGWLSLWTWVPALGLIAAVLPSVVPDGRPLPGRWRLLPPAAAAVVAAGSVLVMVAPRTAPADPALDNPLGWQAAEPAVAPLGLALVALGIALCLLGLVSLVVRARRASGVERRQVAWFGYGLAGTLLATAVAPPGVRALAVLLVPAAVLVAATRYRLYDIDRLVNRTVVAAVLIGGAAVLYAAVAGWSAVVLGDGSPAASFAAAVAVALAFQPARTRVQRLVDRLLLPERLDPQQLLTDLDEAVRHAAGPREALHQGLVLVRDRLHASQVRLLGPGGTVVAEVGEQADDGAAAAVEVDLRQHGERLGRLLVTPGGPGSETLLRSPAVTSAVAGPLTGALQAWSLSAALERSRGAIVTAREEERRRLRRDLHDGLGPQLAAITMTLDTARRALATERVERADALLATAADQSRTAVTDVRAVVAGLRPAALDELGLLGALRSVGPGVLADEQGGGAPATSATSITISGDDHALGPLAAATEVAAYRITQEAMTNAVRHGGASRVEVSLHREDGGLRVSVADDGRGFDPDAVTPGVGLRSMHERAAELGGTLVVHSSPGAGTRVDVLLPDDPDREVP